MNPKLLNAMIPGVIFLTVMSWAHKEFDIPNAMFAMQFIFWVFGAAFVGGVLIPLTINAMKEDPPLPPRETDVTNEREK